MILLIKMLKDLQQNLTQFLAIFIMSFLALFIVSSFGVLNDNNLDRYLKDSNFKDLEIESVSFTQNNIENLQALDGISSVDAWYDTNGTIELDQKYKLLLSFISDNTVSKMYVVEGEPYKKGSSGIWMEERFAKAKDIKVGDYLTIKSENTNLQEKVMGLVNSPEYIDYIGDPEMEEEDYTQYGYGILDSSKCVNTSGIFNKLLVNIEGVDNQLYLSKEENKIIADMSYQIKELLDSKNIILTTKDKDDQVLSYTERIDSYGAMKAVFSVVFGLIAMVGILSTMSRLMAKQRTTIGTLKALGFGSRKVTMHYLSYTIVVVIAGCIAGAVSGYFVLGDVVYHAVIDYYINPYEGKLVSFDICTATILLVILTILVSYSCSMKILKLSTSQILQPDAPKSSKESWYERTLLWKKLRFATQWNVRDVSKNVLRSVISILGVVACSTLLFMATGFLQVMMNVPDWYFGDLITAKNRIEFESDTEYAEVYDYAREYSGQMISDESIEIISDLENVNCDMIVADIGNCYNLQDIEGNYMEFPENGVAISSKAAVLSGLQAGDLVTWKVKGSNRSYCERITAVNKAPMIQGISISRSYYEKMNGSFQPNFVYTNQTVSRTLSERPEVISAIPCSEIKEGIQSVSEESYSTVAIIIFAAVILGVVIMYNMGVMAYTEKVKDMATLKVLGFYAKDLKDIIMQQNIAISFVGMLLGMPFGYQGIMQLAILFGEKTDDFAVHLTALPFVVTIVGVFGIAVIVNKMIVKRIDTIDMVEALKGV